MPTITKKQLEDYNKLCEDEKEVYYRKYTPQTTGYEHEMFMAICQDEPFHYYPFLSDMTGGYALPEHDENEQDSK